ncbi:hypothetical protein D3C81_1732040 [compost metagenome]
MAVEHFTLLQPLSAGRSNIILLDHVDHVGPEVTGQRANAENGHDDHRQGHMVNDLLHVGQPGGVAPRCNHPARRQPFEINSQDLDQEQADEKGRQRHGSEDQHHHQRVEPGILLVGRNYANDDSDKPGEERRYRGQQERVPDIIVEQS